MSYNPLKRMEKETKHTAGITQEMKDRIAWLADTTSSSAWETARMKQFVNRVLTEFLAPLQTELSEMKKEREELRAEVERLTKEKKELIEALRRVLESWENSFDEKYEPWHTAKDLLTRIK